jgi:hypothetical protein
MESLLNWSKWQKKYSGLMRNLMFLISHFSGSNLALAGVAEPNKSVKRDAPPVGGFEVLFLSRFGGFA